MCLELWHLVLKSVDYDLFGFEGLSYRHWDSYPTDDPVLEALFCLLTLVCCCTV